MHVYLRVHLLSLIQAHICTLHTTTEFKWCWNGWADIVERPTCVDSYCEAFRVARPNVEEKNPNPSPHH